MHAHVQVPKSLLKSFSNKSELGRMVYYLNLEKMEIQKDKISVLGTEVDYYSEVIERFLDENIERPFGIIAHKIRAFEKGKADGLNLSVKEHESILNFAYYSILRSSKTLDEANEELYTSIIFPMRHDELLGFSANKIEFNALKNMRVNVILNKTERQFVLPQNCIYDLPSKGTNLLILPLSPHVALSIEPIEYFNENVVDNLQYCHIVGQKEDVFEMNKYALHTEKNYSKGFVVCKREIELKELLE